jgi:uncharacterized membrane protein YczE
MNKRKKIGGMNELAWLFGIVLCGFGIALCTKADFGLSMVAAPPYIIHLKMSEYFSFFSQGFCEYLWEGILLMFMCLGLRRFKIKYLLSFVTAVMSGFVIDFWLTVLGGGAVYESMIVRIITFALGSSLIACAIAFFFRTSMPLQVYELIVAEIADKYKLSSMKVKSVFDICMFVITILLAAFFNKSAQGVGIGTVIVTVFNAPLIGFFGKLLDKYFDFTPRFPKFIAFIGR